MCCAMFEDITCPMKNEKRNWFWDEKRFRKHRLAYRLQITSLLWVVCMCVCESFHQFRHRHASERGKMSFSMHQTEMTLEESIIPTYFRVTGNTQNVTLAHTHTHCEQCWIMKANEGFSVHFFDPKPFIIQFWFASCVHACVRMYVIFMQWPW